MRLLVLARNRAFQVDICGLLMRKHFSSFVIFRFMEIEPHQGHDHDKPYRIDHCFVSSNFEAKDVEIKNFGNWSKKVTICHL
jgi:hypothetical protein